MLCSENILKMLLLMGAWYIAMKLYRGVCVCVCAKGEGGLHTLVEALCLRQLGISYRV